MRIRGDYPERLRGALEHAARLANIFTTVEREEPNAAWARGRAGELRSVTLAVLKEWREKTVNVEAAEKSLADHMDALHRTAVEHLGGSTTLACCKVHEAITAEGEDPTWRARPAARESETVDTTLRAAWVDGPAILARVREGLRCVEAHAVLLERRIGDQCPPEDLRAFGREGLLDAARSFNEARGVPFAGWAALRIRSAMVDGVRRWGGVSRALLRELRGLDELEAEASVGSKSAKVPSSRGILVSASPGALEELADDDRQTPEELVAERELHAVVERAMTKLPPAEQHMVRGLYYEERTLEDAAGQIGLGKSWACRLHARALSTLREELGEAAVRSLDASST